MRKLTFLLIFFALSCNREGEVPPTIETEKKIEIKPGEAMQVVDYAEIAEIESLIPLETPDETPIGRLDKVLFTNDYIIVLDKLTASIFIFSKMGEFESRISKRGKGPDEYLSIQNISLSGSDAINVVDNSLKTIRKYTLEGEQLETKKTIGWPDDYFENNSYEYLSIYSSHNEKEDDIHYINIKNNNNTKGYFPFRESILSSRRVPKIFFTDSDGSVLCRRHYDDNIYRLEGEELKIAYDIDFGEHSFPTEKLLEAKTLEEYIEIIEKEGGTGNISGIYITDNYLHFKYTHEGQLNTYIKKLNTDEEVHYSSARNSEGVIPFFPVGNDAHHFYGILKPWNYAEETLDIINEKYNLELETESTHNVLIKYTYKF